MRPEGQTAIVVAPRLVLRLLAGAHPHPLSEEIGADTRIALPEGFHGPYRNVLTGEDHTPRAGPEGLHLRPAEVLAHFPLALLEQPACGGRDLRLALVTVYHDT